MLSGVASSQPGCLGDPRLRGDDWFLSGATLDFDYVHQYCLIRTVIPESRSGIRDLLRDMATSKNDVSNQPVCLGGPRFRGDDWFYPMPLWTIENINQCCLKPIVIPEPHKRYQGSA